MTVKIRKHEAVVIIGGGPAGLLTAHYLKSFGIDPVVLEKGVVGESWHGMKKRMVMLSPAAAAHDLTSLTYDNPIWTSVKLNGPFATREEFIEYLDRFVSDNKIRVREKSPVSALSGGRDGFAVEVKGKPACTADVVVVATGVIGNPCFPPVPGIDGNKRVVHSRDYKGFEYYRGKKVLIVGGGNSGAELTIELSGIAEVTLSTRSKLKYFSKTRDLSHIRGLSESLLKELIQFGIVELKEGVEVKKIDGGKAAFTDGTKDTFDEMIFATGYCPHIPQIDGLTVKKAKSGYPKVDADCQSLSAPGLFFTGPLAHTNRYCSFIHCFRPMVEPMALAIADRLGR